MRFVVAEHAVAIFHPRMRCKAAVPHPDADTDATPGDPVPLENAIQRDRAYEAERAKNAELRGAPHRQRERFRARRDRRHRLDGLAGRVGRVRDQPPGGASPYPELCDE